MGSYTKIASKRLSWREFIGIWIAGPKYHELAKDSDLDAYELALRECYNICGRHRDTYVIRKEYRKSEAAQFIQNSIHAKMASM